MLITNKMTQNLSQRTKGIISIIGACLLYLTVGSTYILGNINIYVCSYFPNVTSDNTKIIFPITTVVGNTITIFSIPLCKLIGYRAILILSTILTFGFIFASTFCTNFWLFFVCFGVGYGGTTGLLYLTILYNGFKYFPKRKGLIGGILMGIYGFSSLISNYILLFSMNPNNMKAIEDPNTKDFYFPKEIAERLPSALRTLSYYFLVIMILGNFLQFEYKQEENQQENSNKNPLLLRESNSKEITIETDRNALISNDEIPCTSLIQALKSKAFYLILMMTFFSIQNGYFMASNFKDYGFSKISDDSFLTLVGSLSSVFNGGGRFFWGVLSDKFDFKKIYLMILVIQIADMATLRLISQEKSLYLIWVCVALLCEGGHFVIFPVLCLKVFGVEIGAKVYSLILLFGIAFANLTQFWINLVFRPMIGYENEFYIFLGFTTISFLICLSNKIKF